MAKAENLDSRLLRSQAEEQDAARELKEKKRGKTNGSSPQKYFDELTQTAYNLEELLNVKNRREGVKRGIVLGMKMRRLIKEGDFSGSKFMTVLLLSVLKDFVDIVAAGTFGVLINIPISIFLFIVFFMQLPIIRKYILKRFIWPVIIEYIPFLSIFPTYTISTIWLKMKIDKRNKEMGEQLDQIEREFNLNQNFEYVANV